MFLPIIFAMGFYMCIYFFGYDIAGCHKSAGRLNRKVLHYFYLCFLEWCPASPGQHKSNLFGDLVTVVQVFNLVG